jgi:hypothetical protein
MTTIDLEADIPGARLTHGEVYEIGAALLSWVAMVGRLGHTSPASTLDYTRELGSIPALIVRDFVAWTSGRTDKVPGEPSERLAELVAKAGWEPLLLASLNDSLAGVRA